MFSAVAYIPAWNTSLFALGLQLLKFLQETDCPLDEVDHLGRTALALAAEKNLADAIHVLLDRGADGNKGTAAGETPLLIAAREGCVDAVAVLLQHGCDAHLMSADGDLPLLAAVDCGHYYVVEGKFRLRFAD